MSIIFGAWLKSKNELEIFPSLECFDLSKKTWCDIRVIFAISSNFTIA